MENRKEFMASKYGSYWIKARKKYQVDSYHKNYINFINKNIDNQSRILDVGIGTGFPFAANFKDQGYEVYGIDISSELINECNKNYSSIKSSVGDAENIRFKDGFFNCTYCFASTWYFPDIYKSIDEMIRVTEKGGLVCFDIQNAENEAVKNNYLKRVNDKKGINLFFHYLKNLVKILANRGFVDWTNIIYDIPNNPANVYTHINNKNFQEIDVYDANANLNKIDIKKISTEKSGCLLFVIKV